MMPRPFPEMQAIACAHANPVQNGFVRAFFYLHSFSKQFSQLIATALFPDV